MTSVHQRLLLRSLQIPNAESVNTLSDSEFRGLVVWLEQKLIRQYRPEDRSPILDIKSERWPAAFMKYLDDLECPIEHSGAALHSPTLLDWLLHYAVDLMHGDKVKEMAPLDTSSNGEHLMEVDEQTAQDFSFSDVGQPEVQAAVANLLKHLRLEDSSKSLAEKLSSARQFLADSIVPALRDVEVQKSRGRDAGSSAVLDMDNYPLGFSTKDDNTDLAAKILRMLYIKDLRALQTQIDDMTVQIQEFTANPRVVVGLGVVGR